jgi:hypothetical protein
LVPIEEKVRSAAIRIVNAVNGALAEMGKPTFDDVEKTKAVMFVVIREDDSGSLIFGRSSNSRVLRAALATLVDANVISEEFAKALWLVWMAHNEPPKE